MAAPSQRVHTHGTGNFVQMAGRDIVEELHVHALAEFLSPSLDDVKPPAFEVLPVADPLTERLRRQRLLILGGTSLAEKTTIARHLAWYLGASLDHGAGEDDLPVQEWIRSAARPRLDAALAEEKQPTIFLLPRVQPYHLDHDPERLRHMVERAGHYAVVTTDTADSQWGLDNRETARELWVELLPRQVYEPGYLGYFLCNEIHRVEGTLPQEVRLREAPPSPRQVLDLPLVVGLTVGEVVEHLQTPDQISSLVRWIAAAEGRLDAPRLREVVHQLAGDRAAIHRWYRQLDERQQLLALGLALFDGLFDDQLFAALELMMDLVWRPRNPALAAFDYCDLEALTGYFRLTEAAAGGVRVETHSAQQRQALLEVAWKLHRRQLLATLPVLTRLVRQAGDRWSTVRERWSGRSSRLWQMATEAFDTLGDRGQPAADPAEGEPKTNEEEGEAAAAAERPSGEGEDGNAAGSLHLSRWQRYGPANELAGTRARKERFFAVAAEALSHLASLAFHAVESCLMELAADGARDVQVVAARAMARWREQPESERLLFKTLKAWRDEAAVKERLRRAVNPRDRRATNPLAQVRATVALTVGYAVLYDRPNRLHDELQELLAALADDHQPDVRDRFCFQTLPFALSLHRRQLEPLVEDLVRYTELISPIGLGWAYACRIQPADALGLLDEWRQSCRTATPANPQVLTLRETRLATVALTYGSMSFDGQAAPVPQARAFGELRQILAETHPFVRQQAVLALVLQAGHSLGEVEAELRASMAAVSLEERNLLLGTFKRLYLEQRRTLSGCDDELPVKEIYYPVWLDGAKRPETGVEKVLRDWLADGSQPVAQQIALEALAVFSATPLDREERKWRKAREEEAEEEARQAAAPVAGLARWQPQPLRPTGWVTWVAAAVLTLFELKWRPTLAALAPEMIHLRRSDPQALEALLTGWPRQGEELEAIRRHLGRFDVYYRHRNAVHLGVAGGLTLLMILLAVVVG